ncbi:hypothetical protein AGMMS49938_18550 [Fibrobacterales bacterium]|nr:hypothetical protein AGMMS49938_18550 [Fibrobacterales bacterium]
MSGGCTCTHHPITIRISSSSATTYTKSDLPQVSVSVSKGTVEGVPVLECQKVEVIGPGDTTFLEVNPVWEWNEIVSLSSITPILNTYRFSKTTDLDAASPGEYGEGKGPKKEVKARATCNGIEKTVICKNTFTVSGDVPNEAVVTCDWPGVVAGSGQGSEFRWPDGALPTLPGPSNVSCSGRSPIIIDKWVVRDQNEYLITELNGSASPAYPGTGSFLDPSGVQKYYAKVSKCGALTPSNANQEVLCGTLTVGAVPSIVSCEVTEANSTPSNHTPFILSCKIRGNNDNW